MVNKGDNRMDNCTAVDMKIICKIASEFPYAIETVAMTYGLCGGSEEKTREMLFLKLKYPNII
jgi:hypothetical protein